MLSCALMDPARFESRIVCGPETGTEGELVSEARRRGVVVEIERALVRDVNPWMDLAAAWRLWRRIRRGRYDVVHVHTSKAGIVGRLAAWLAGTPVVIHTAHGWAFTREGSAAGRGIDTLLERACAALCHAIVVVADSDRVEGLKRGVGRPQQYRLIRSGIEIEAYRDCPLDRAQARARLSLPGDAFVIGTVGRLGAQKAPLDLLAAFEQVARARPEAHLVLVGDGPQRGDVEARAAEAGLRDRVHVLGVRRDVPEIQRALDVFALSSRWEGLPRVLPQAMAAGLPIVATRVSGAPEAIRPGENGWLVEPGDTGAMAQRLLELAADPARAREMGRRGRERVEEFSARRMVDELAALYVELARRRGLPV